MFDTIARLDELLKERNLSLGKLCEASNLNHSTVSMSKKRHNQLSLDTIERLCSGLGITLAEFFTEKEALP